MPPDEAVLPKWRNWQTRQVQDLVSVKDVEVRVLSSALRKAWVSQAFLRFLMVRAPFRGTIQGGNAGVSKEAYRAEPNGTALGASRTSRTF
jgi:hypothetical protein